MSEKLNKKVAHELVDRLPECTTWADLLYAVYVQDAVESGMVDSEAGRTVSVEEVRAKFGLSD